MNRDKLYIYQDRCLNQILCGQIFTTSVKIFYINIFLVLKNNLILIITKIFFMKTQKRQSKFNFVASLKFLIFLFVLVLSSCQETDETAPNDDGLEKQEAFNQVAKNLEKKYFIISKRLNENDFSFQFPDGRVLNSKLKEGKWEISGSAVNNKSFILPKFNKKDYSDFEGSNLQKFFRSNVGLDLLNQLANNNLERSNQRIQKCVSGETFDQCFVREADEFCDGFVGCAAIFIFPEIIVPLIASYCAGCSFK